jgi:methionyl-tRNA formyltransferase
LFLIEKDIINFPSKLIFNIHGSLLPKYRGRTPHVWSIINGEEEAGITAHIIDEGCDTGDILHQIRITIDSNDTGATILEKYNQHYLPLIDKILLDFQNNKLSPRKQNELDASYFGKRTPESGQIDWSWDTNRIRNWVRAQALPYPGAFSFIDGIKIIIDKVETISTIDFKGIVNGTIVTIDNSYCVKCSDGIVKLTNIRTNTSIIKNGKIFK